MTLAELFEAKFRGDIRFRGAAYLKADRVAITRVSADTIYGVVRDGEEYQTQLARHDDELKMYCNCVGDDRPTPTCKHLWATLLAADANGYVTGGVKAGHFPPFIIDEPNLAFDAMDELWDEGEAEASASGLTVRSSRRASPSPRPVVEERLRPWEAQLNRIRGELSETNPSGTAGSLEREIYYELDLPESQQTERLVLQVSQRQRRTSGQWGKRKPLKIRTGAFDDIERDDDRTILAYLCGGTPERANWHTRQAQSQTAVHRFHLPYELCVLVLPLMCATGRVHILGSKGNAGSAIQWDDGDPWELCIGIEKIGKPGESQLIGRLTRGEETLAVAEADLLLPGGLLLRANRFSQTEDFDAFGWIKSLRRPEPVLVPDGEDREFVDQLFQMPALPRVELPEHLHLQEVSCDPVPQLKIRTPSGHRWHSNRLTAEVSFDYDGTLVDSGTTGWAVVQRDLGRCLLRNRPRETAAWARLQDCGFRKLLDRRRGGRQVEIAARGLGPAVRTLMDEGWQITADGQGVRRAEGLQFRIQSGIDWFELHAEVSFGSAKIAFPELLSAIVRGDGTVRLDDGSLGILPEEWQRRYGLLAGLGTVEEGHLRFAQHQVGLLDALLSAQESVDFDTKFGELKEKFRSFTGVTEATEPREFVGTLRTYQREGLGWLQFLQDFKFGGCLADDMGLGKTIQILAMLENRRAAGGERLPSLVVMPKSLLFNWRQECERFTPKLKLLEYTGLDRASLRSEFPQHDVILTTYGTMRRDAVLLREFRFDYVVLDEAQMIKNPGSQVAKASRLLQADFRVALSGTPIENHLGDLWSIFEFLNPGMLGRSSLFKSLADDAADESSRQTVAQGLRPFILRRTKSEVASELPDKFEQTISCEMGKEQRRMYEDLRDHYRQSLLGMVQDQGLAKTRMHVLEALLRLRQAACHPALLDKTLIEQPSAKLDVLCPQIEELIAEGHKALIFSQFTSMLAIVRQRLDKRGIDYEYLDGQSRKRRESVERFQNDPKCGLFLISLKAGGLGLNLTAADYVFLLDPWWNPAVEAQAIDRAHRVGQTKQVFAYRLICRNTVEEKIAELQQKKRGLADAILQADNRMLKNLTKEDLEVLLS